MLKEWLLKYRDRFDENFPVFMLRGKTDDEVINLIKKCMETDTPYEVTDPDSSLDY